MYYEDQKKQEMYDEVANQLEHLMGIDGKYEMDDIGKMATFSSVTRLNIPYYLFVGFYRVTAPQMLQIGPYQGSLIACGNIPFDKGVCGASAKQEKTIIVPDVTKFPGYIACDDETQSEIVVPVFQNGRLSAVLDVDSVDLDSFNEVDQTNLEKLLAQYFK